MTKIVLWFRGRVWCRSLCCLGFDGMLVSHVDILSVLTLVVSSVMIPCDVGELKDGWGY